MGYTYSKVTTHTVTDGSKYFLDSNIWLKILQPKISPSFKDKNYRLLFDEVYNAIKGDGSYFVNQNDVLAQLSILEK